MIYEDLKQTLINIIKRTTAPNLFSESFLQGLTVNLLLASTWDCLSYQEEQLIPVDLILELYSEKSYTWNIIVASLIATPLEILRELSEHEDPYISIKARQTISRKPRQPFLKIVAGA